MWETIGDWAIGVCLSVLWLWGWSLMRIVLRHERCIQDLRRTNNVEQRCGFCLVSDCQARDTGIIYPCPYFRDTFTKKEMEDLYGEER